MVARQGKLSAGGFSESCPRTVIGAPRTENSSFSEARSHRVGIWLRKSDCFLHAFKPAQAGEGVQRCCKSKGLDPAGVTAQCLPHGAALGDAGLADEDEQVEVPSREGEQILVEPGIGGQIQGSVRVASLAGGHALPPTLFGAK